MMAHDSSFSSGRKDTDGLLGGWIQSDFCQREIDARARLVRKND